MVKANELRHPLRYADGILGCAGYNCNSIVGSYYKNSGMEFSAYGIVQNSLLIIDKSMPEEPAQLNLYKIDAKRYGKQLVKLSKIPVKGGEYYGRVVACFNNLAD